MSKRQFLLGKKIDEYCVKDGKQSKLTHEQFAEILDVSVDTVSKWVRGKSYPRKNEQRFIERLGWTTELMRECRADYYGSSYNYTVQSFGEYLGHGNTLKNLSERTERILEFYPIPDIDGNDMGSMAEWSRIYTVSLETGYVLIDKNAEICGYWFIVSANHDFYERILLGENANKSISPSDIRLIDQPGDYDIYFVDFFFHPSHMNPKTKQLLFNKFFELINSFAESGIFFKRISANITTDLAENFCISRGFEYVCDHKYHRVCFTEEEQPSKIYELNLHDRKGDKLFSGENNLRKLYENHFPV